MTAFGAPDIEADARRAHDVLDGGGIVLFASDIGYGFLTSSVEKLRLLMTAKQRPLTKRNGILTDHATQSSLHVLDERARAAIAMLANDFRLPIGVVAPFDPAHPLMVNMSSEMRQRCTYHGTIATFLNNGRFSKILARLNRERGYVPVLGSSANLSGTGNQYRVEDVPPMLRDLADLTIDYGPAKYAISRRGATAIDFSTMEVIRIGACYDVIADLLRCRFDVDMPVDPGYDALPLGHIKAPLEPLEVTTGE